MSAVIRPPRHEPRPMAAGDLAAVLRIEQQSYRFPWSMGIFRDCLRVGYCCWVVPVADRVRAYGIMSIAAGEAHILNVCVDESVRRQGLAWSLIEHLRALALNHRADTVLLEVRPTNQPALDLYRKMGFSEVGVRRGYYRDSNGREDALILEYRFDAAASG